MRYSISDKRNPNMGRRTSVMESRCNETFRRAKHCRKHRMTYAKVYRSRDILELMRCPICLGILRNTRTVMECLHRFCRECIDKAMRLGRKECPTCRAHCASRRSLRDDPHFDALIAAMFPDIEKLQKEESTLLEETLISNRQTQKKIEEAVKRQSEAVARFKRPKSVGSKTRIATYSRGAGCEDERFRDVSVVPDLNNAGAKSSIRTNVNILHLDNNEADVEMEQYHGLKLLSELADQDEFSSLTPTPSLKRIVIKDIDSGISKSTEVRIQSDRKKDRQGKKCSSVSKCGGELVVMGAPSKENQRGKAMEISPTPTDDGLLGNGGSITLLQLDCVRMCDEYHDHDKENWTAEGSRSQYESQNGHGGPKFAYESGISSRKEGQTQAKVVTCGSTVHGEIPSVRRTQAKSSKREKMCSRASTLLNHLAAKSRKEKDDEYVIHLQLRPLVNLSDGVDVFLGLEKPYLCCPPQMTIQHLCKFVAGKAFGERRGMVELLISTSSPSTGASWLKRAENMEVQVLREEYTLHYVLSKFWQARGEMILLYRCVEPNHHDKLRANGKVHVHGPGHYNNGVE
ncbi:E3 ubiquitin-protein ligase RNF1/2 [Marchantia polymorpha subsp. ruderalis]|uniref:RING-type domain-containing protein n=2 Tax=Marchantia polymorpha TaxID=3197 RepID=A0AAF6AQG2_MARPO|nr:hypothetical protein MARPO_0033s0121 [Marchantia polymorpha]PTQ41727.1 hypothetical protein MARPO_0033s0121 [Marchantia polymorpha]BBM98681.1 hypothetical protein Mp_1g15400 [Marchantia polymorpha subsp. ruderalis]BBM98682.1 hypothetical protein Mp_1g15400 [Marchantia polymorpha subsp. ruderalis]|eukprot:PTQ41726.1 hypothetical protein MARPO_0033s0121 [Marchantia polymorpha]